MRTVILSVLAILTAAIILQACNKGNGNDQPADNFDRKPMLTNLADNIIVPAYSDFEVKFTAMKTASVAFTGSPDASTLNTLQTKWQEAYIGWQKVELFSFGPADDVLLRNHMNIYPTDVTLLTNYVNTGTYDLEQLSTNKVQGFPALDYLLNGLASNDADILAKYTGPDGAKWKKYLTDVIGIMNSKLTSVVNAWKGDYRNTFVNSTGTGAGSSTSLMVNEYIMNFERFLRSGKFAIPAGVMTGTPAPQYVEAYYSRTLGMTLAKTALQASSDFYEGKAFNGGTPGSSLKTYLNALGTNNPSVAQLATNISTQFNTIRTKMDGLGNNIYDAIVNNRSAVLALYDEFQIEIRYLKVDMASAIGVTISYTDTDGD